MFLHYTALDHSKIADSCPIPRNSKLEFCLWQAPGPLPVGPLAFHQPGAQHRVHPPVGHVHVVHRRPTEAAVHAALEASVATGWSASDRIRTKQGPKVPSELFEHCLLRISLASKTILCKHFHLQNHQQHKQGAAGTSTSFLNSRLGPGPTVDETLVERRGRTQHPRKKPQASPFQASEL